MMQSLNSDQSELKARNKKTMIVLLLVAFGFYGIYILSTALNG